ncbi:unnamed protein product [Trichobilharzia szidati]|nr:unnamed protein product [Trichobilharzia szidati]
MPVNTDDDFRETSSGDENDNVLAITTSRNKQTKCFRKIRTVGRNLFRHQYTDSNKQLVEEQCHGIQPRLSQSELTDELIRYSHIINTIRQTNPQLFLVKIHQ